MTHNIIAYFHKYDWLCHLATFYNSWCEHVQVRQPYTIASTARNTVHKHTFIEALFHGCVQFLVHALKYNNVLHFISVGPGPYPGGLEGVQTNPTF